MEELLNQLVEERAKVWHQGKEVLDRIHAAKKAVAKDPNADGPDAQDEETWSRINADLDRLDAEIAQLNDRVRGEKIADEARANVEHLIRPAEDPKPDMKGDESLVNWMRAGVSDEPSGPKKFDVNLAGLTVDRHGDGRYEIKDVLTTSDDPALVPTDFRRVLYEHLIENSAIRRTNVTIFPTTGGNPIEMPKTTKHPGGTVVSEGSAIPEDDPEFAQGTLNAHKYGDLVQIPTELLTDEGLPAGVLINYLARQTAQALANKQGAHFVTGTGSGQPEGFIVGGTHVGVTGGTGVSGAPTADDLIDLQYSVIEPYADRGFWILRRATVGTIRKLKDDNGQYLWAAGLNGAPNTILDRPYVSDPNMPAVATDATSISFGDFSTYFIREVANVRFERSDDFAFDKDVTTFRALQRVDGLLLDTTGAIKHFVGAAS